MRRRGALAVSALLLQGTTAPARASAPLLAFTENLPPLNHEQDGQARGFSVELLRLMAEQLGRPVQIQVLPWPRAVATALHTPDSLLFSLTRTPEREVQFRWVGPIAERRILLYELAAQPLQTVQRLTDLAGQRIGAVRDSAIARLLVEQGLQPGRDLEFTPDDAGNLRMLLGGRLRYVALLDWAAAWHLRQQQLPYDQLRPVLELDTSRSYWFGLPLNADPALVKALQGALDQLRRDGRYQRLRDTYFR